jgi:hypothetical protein
MGLRISDTLIIRAGLPKLARARKPRKTMNRIRREGLLRIAGLLPPRQVHRGSASTPVRQPKIERKPLHQDARPSTPCVHLLSPTRRLRLRRWLASWWIEQSEVECNACYKARTARLFEARLKTCQFPASWLCTAYGSGRYPCRDCHGSGVVSCEVSTASYTDVRRLADGPLQDVMGVVGSTLVIIAVALAFSFGAAIMLAMVFCIPMYALIEAVSTQTLVTAWLGISLFIGTGCVGFQILDEGGEGTKTDVYLLVVIALALCAIGFFAAPAVIAAYHAIGLFGLFLVAMSLQGMILISDGM